LGLISRASGSDHLSDIQFMAMTLPGPTTYSPKKESVMKRFGVYVKLEIPKPP